MNAGGLIDWIDEINRDEPAEPTAPSFKRAAGDTLIGVSVIRICQQKIAETFFSRFDLDVTLSRIFIYSLSRAQRNHLRQITNWYEIRLRSDKYFLLLLWMVVPFGINIVSYTFSSLFFFIISLKILYISRFFIWVYYFT